MMNCSEFNNMLDNYVTLTTNEKFMLDQHAAVCEKCRGELEFYKSIVNVSSSLPAFEPPADLLDKINAGIDNLPTSTRVLDKTINNFKVYRRQYATVAACVAVGLAVGLNSKTIHDRLTNENTDGVISTSTSVSEPDNGNKLDDYLIEDQTPEQEPESSETVVANNTAEDEPASGQAEIPARVIPTISPKQANVYTNPTPAKPTAKSQQTTRIVSTVANKPAQPAAKTPTPQRSTTVKATTAPVVTEAPQKPVEQQPTVSPETAPPTAEQSQNNTKNKYTIAHGNYHVPEAAAAPEPTQAPSSTSDKSIAGEKYQIAMGTYEVSEEEKKAVSQNKLIVNAADVNTVISYMNNSWVRAAVDGYTATPTAFANFLAKLDAAGIYYNYLQLSDTGNEVRFTLLLN